MKILTRLALFTILIAATLTARAAATSKDRRDVLLGTWQGTSICTGARAACHDETAVYHVTAASAPNVVTMAMNKVVDHREVEMGILDYTVDFDAHTLVGDVDNPSLPSRWTFTWTETELKGIAVLLPSGTKIRDILLHRAAKPH
jgi:hypothetical protein